MFGLFDESVGGRSCTRTGYITIPANGTGTAGRSDFTSWLNDQRYPGDASGDYWGCGQDLSWDGTLCVANSGWIGSNCLANKKSISTDGNEMDHKGFYITKYIGRSDPQVTIDQQIDQNQYGVSINWCPSSYRFGSFQEVDFNNWAFSNDNEYVIGSLKGSSASVKCIWVIHWPDGKWHMVTPQNNTTVFDDPAMFVTAHPNAVGDRPGAADDRPAGAFARNGLTVDMTDGRRELTIPAGRSGLAVFAVSGRLLWNVKRSAPLTRDQVVTLPGRIRGAALCVVR